jgi:hypothetical protein
VNANFLTKNDADRDGVPIGRNTQKEIQDLIRKLPKEEQNRLLNMRIWHDWCRLHKETIYWGA